MSVLVVAVRRSDEHALGIAAVAEHLVISDPGPRTWWRLADDLRHGSVLGAKLLTEVSTADLQPGVAQAGRLVVVHSERRIAEGLLKHGWTRDDQDDTNVVLWPPAAAAQATQSVCAEDFEHSIASPNPVSTTIELANVDPDSCLFGVFATSRLGGSSALLALSGAHPGDKLLELRNPAALGLHRVDHDARSITARAQAGSVRCTALGLSESDEDIAWARFDDSKAMSALWKSHEVGVHDFWLLVELAAPDVDPPVWLPAGQIFEQQGLTGRQTLATTTTVNTVVSPGRLTALLLPAFCLDQNLHPPSADPMHATPLRVPISAGATQHQVWAQRAAARGPA